MAPGGACAGPARRPQVYSGAGRPPGKGRRREPLAAAATARLPLATKSGRAALPAARRPLPQPSVAGS